MRLRFSVALWALILAFAPGVNSRCRLSAQPPDPGKYSAADHKVAEFHDVMVPMRDGVKLAIDVFRPEGEGRFPVVLCMTPYNRRCQAGTGQPDRAIWLAARGYAAVNADLRGRFKSEGTWDPFSPKQKTDGYDLVEWLAGQAWSTGKVGTWGLSFQGWTQWWTATQAPPSLVTIVPDCAPPDQFRNLPYQDGILCSFMMDWGCGMQGSGEGGAGPIPTRYRYEEMFTPYIDLPSHRNLKSIPWFDTWIRDNLSTSDYWKGIAYQNKESYEKIKVPSLAVSGWFDCTFPGTPMNYLGMKRYGGTPEARRPRIVIGPWPHGGRGRTAYRFDHGPTAAVDWNGYTCRWFDYHLKGIENGVLDDPPVHVFVMGRNRWRAENDWPLPETKWTKFYFHGGGKANSSAGDGTLGTTPPAEEPPDRYTYDPMHPTPSMYKGVHITGPDDSRECSIRQDVLVYSTPPLEEEIEVTGPITAKLYAATSARDTDWMVRLIDVWPDGYEALLCGGVLRARCRDPQRGGAFNSATLSTIEPNEVYEYVIEFWRATGNVFLKGHRIRIEVSSSYFPYFLRNLNTGADNVGLETSRVVAQQTIYHDAARPSHVVLPVIPNSGGR